MTRRFCYSLPDVGVARLSAMPLDHALFTTWGHNGRLLLAALMLASGTLARAETFTFYVYGNNYVATQPGFGTVTATPFTGQYGESDYKVTSIAGMMDGSAITGLESKKKLQLLSTT